MFVFQVIIIIYPKNVINTKFFAKLANAKINQFFYFKSYENKIKAFAHYFL